MSLQVIYKTIKLYKSCLIYCCGVTRVAKLKTIKTNFVCIFTIPLLFFGIVEKS